MANSVDPDQTAPLGAVWSGSALFAYVILSETLVFEILGHLPYFNQKVQPLYNTNTGIQNKNPIVSKTKCIDCIEKNDIKCIIYIFVWIQHFWGLPLNRLTSKTIL